MSTALTGPTAEVQGQLSDLLYEQMALNEQIRSLREQLTNMPPPVVNLTTPDRAVEVITSTTDLSGLESMLGALLEAFQRDPGNGAIAEALQALRKDLDAQSERMIHVSGRPGVYGGGALGNTEIMVLGNPASNLNGLPVDLGQDLDANNTTTRTSANGATQFVGGWTRTRSVGYVRLLTVVASDVASGLGGSFVFEFSEDGTNATISESRPITDFATVRDFDLLNAGEFYRIKFTPSRALTGAEHVFITTTLRKQNDGAFVRLANQPQEEANAAMPQVFAYLKLFDQTTGKSVNLRPNAYGDQVSVPTRGTYAGAAGVSGSVSVPSGAVVRSYAAQSGSVAATISVPGITGNITVPGSNQAQTQYADSPDPYTMIGPCTFVFTNTASYVVTWVL